MLSISIVTYKSDLDILEQLFESLKTAINRLPDNIRIDAITIIDNGNQYKKIKSVLKTSLDDLPFLKLISNPDNVGYGKAHNQAINSSKSRYYLILNPDVIMDENCLVKGINYLEMNTDVVALSPFATGKSSESLFLTKKYPSVLDLFIRALGNKFTGNVFKSRLSNYENRKVVESGKAVEVDIISGCFMLCRTEPLKKAGCFDEKYFLYFEDFSLSMELKKFGKLVYLPEMRIVHFGGYASRKGAGHIIHFINSGIRFFNRYGWKIL